MPTAEPEARAAELRQTLELLEGRDTQLWSIAVLMILVLAAGVAALLLPNLLWDVGPVRIEGSYLPPLLYGFISLIILFNIYALSQKRSLRRLRGELMSQVALREAAEREALHDPLTGAYNRRYLEHLLTREVNRANRHSTPISLLVIDADDFRSVNTRFGHAEGDRLLQEIARLLIGTFRTTDTVIRFGGDEFLVVLPESDEAQAQEAVTRLQRRVEDWNRAHPDAGYQMKLSCGLACYQKGVQIADVLQIADQRMYLRKKNPAAVQ